jgi:DNA-binding NarL/FixJ family response regulator
MAPVTRLFVARRPRMIRVLLAEDHTLVRAGIKALLSSLPDIQVVAEVADGREALRLIQAEHPDVVLMDISMPWMNGLDATAQVSRDFPKVSVIILSMHAAEEYVLLALSRGAKGYLLKDAGVQELELAVRSVARGDIYLSPSVSKTVVADYMRRTGNRQESTPPDTLTPRQREVLQLIAEGRNTREIAGALNITAKTVETHRAQLKERLDIHDTAGLVRYAIRAGLVTSDDVRLEPGDKLAR